MTIHSLSLQPAASALQRPGKTNVGDRVFSAPWLNDRILKFLPIINQDQMKRVSKSCLASAERLQRQDLCSILIGHLDRIPPVLMDDKKRIELVKSAPIRNFHREEIEIPFSQYPEWMIGWISWDGQGLKPYCLSISRSYNTKSWFNCCSDTICEETRILSVFLFSPKKMAQTVTEMTYAKDNCCCNKSPLAYWFGCTETSHISSHQSEKYQCTEPAPWNKRMFTSKKH